MRYATLLIPLIALFAVACGDGENKAPAPTSTASPAIDTPPAAVESPFPVVLEHETLIVASADGSEITETPLEPGERPAFPPSDISPDGERTAIYRDGMLMIQKGDDEPTPILEIPSESGRPAFWWSPDSSHMLFDASYRDESPSLYVINADGSGLTDVGAGLEGDAFPVGWSPEGQRFAMGLYTPVQQSAEGLDALLYVVRADGTERTLTGEYLNFHGYEGSADLAKWSPDGSRIAVFSPPSEGAIRLMDASGGPPVDIPGSPFPGFSWSPDSRHLALDGRPPVGGDSDTIMVVDIASPGQPRLLTEGFRPRWSPDGERIAFMREGQVYTIRPDGSDLAVLGDAGQDFRSDLTWSEDGHEVEWVQGAPAVQHLYAIDVRDGTVTRTPGSLTEAGYRDSRRIELAPNADEIALHASGGKKGRAPGWYTMDVATGNLTQVTDESRGGDIYWSPEGIRLAFSAGGNGVFVAEGDRSPPRRISDLRADGLAWSPDGKYVAFGAGEDIHVLDVDGTDDRVVAGLTPAFERVLRIEWSPDGTQLLYEAETSLQMGGDTTETFVASLDGAPPVPLFDPQIGVFGARWSPDGETIAFSRREDSTREVWLMDAAGGDERRLASLDEVAFGGGQLRWSPDGASIAAVVGSNDVYIIDVGSGSSLHVATAAASCRVALLGWSPDSQRIYAVPTCEYQL